MFIWNPACLSFVRTNSRCSTCSSLVLVEAIKMSSKYIIKKSRFCGHWAPSSWLLKMTSLTLRSNGSLLKTYVWLLNIKPVYFWLFSSKGICQNAWITSSVIKYLRWPIRLNTSSIEGGCVSHTFNFLASRQSLICPFFFMTVTNGFIYIEWMPVRQSSLLLVH